MFLKNVFYFLKTQSSSNSTLIENTWINNLHIFLKPMKLRQKILFLKIRNNYSTIWLLVLYKLFSKTKWIKTNFYFFYFLLSLLKIYTMRKWGDSHTTLVRVSKTHDQRVCTVVFRGVSKNHDSRMCTVVFKRGPPLLVMIVPNSSG